jgi:catechol 2,3-dioxygenase-like lactoylglutathione lyase family enzyme
MKLGASSISLAVKDLNKSKEFYEKLGFKQFGGDPDMNYLMMKNGDSVIGLFQGMFEGNIITFNPGWDQEGKDLDSFDDVREIEKNLKKNEVPLIKETEAKEGPESIMLTDPDGNTILIDQHR